MVAVSSTTVTERETNVDVPTGVVRTIEAVPVGLLSFDPTVNRAPIAAKVRKIRENFQPMLVGVPVVSKRTDGDYVVLDGQHRVLAIVTNPALGEEYELPCECLAGLTREQEAAIFLGLNRDRTPTKPYDQFRVGVVAGNPSYVAIQRVLSDLGLKAGASAGTNRVGCVRALESILDKHGEEILHTALAVLVDAFGRDAETFDADLCHAVAIILATNPGVDAGRLAARMSKDGKVVLSPAQWKRRAALATGATGGNSRWPAIAKLLVNAYNTRLAPHNRIN
jgi:hypothetical protein